MRESLFYKYKEDFSEKISKVFEKIDVFEKEIKDINIGISLNDPFDIQESAIHNFKWEIIKYFQYNNGSLGFDIVLIKYILRELLIYVYILKEKELSEEEKNTCEFEIEIRFCFFLNCIYNFKEKLETFFNIKIDNARISFKSTILTSKGQNSIIILFDNFYSKIKNYCKARGGIVHNIYNIKYDILENKINESSSKFNLSEENLVNIRPENHNFILDDDELTGLVEEIQKIRKEVIEILLDIRKNIDLTKLTNKYSSGRGIYKF